MFTPHADQHHLPAAAMLRARNGFTIRQEAAGTITVTSAADLWSPEDIDRHFDRLATVIDEQRRAGQQVRVLVDLRAAPPQPTETLARIGTRTVTTYRPGDRVAIVVTSSLAKMQMRDIMRSGDNALFLSADAARLWLHAFDGARA